MAAADLLATAEDTLRQAHALVAQKSDPAVISALSQYALALTRLAAVQISLVAIDAKAVQVVQQTLDADPVPEQ